VAVARDNSPISTERVHLFRQRRRAGKVVRPIAVALERTRNVLIAAGVLKEWDAENDAAFNAALEHAIDLWIADEERRRGLC
jgi:hypothetical protein